MSLVSQYEIMGKICTFEICSVLLQDSAIMLKELTQKSVLKRMSRILSRPSVAKVEKGLPIFQLQKKIKSFFNS